MKEPLWVWLAAVILGTMFPAFVVFLPHLWSVVIWIVVMIAVINTGAYLENKKTAKASLAKKG